MGQNKQDFILDLLKQGESILEERLPEKAENFKITSKDKSKITYEYFDQSLGEMNTGRIFIAFL